MVYVYYQPNSCTTHTEREWAGGTFLRQRKEVPPAHAQRAYLSTVSREFSNYQVVSLKKLYLFCDLYILGNETFYIFVLILAVIVTVSVAVAVSATITIAAALVSS